MSTEVKKRVRRQRCRSDGIIKTLPGERFTPFSVAKKLNARVLLESSSFKKGKERYSILMVREAFTVFERNRKTYLQIEGKKYQIKNHQGDILDALLYFARQHSPLHQDFPFPAGGVGFLGYEYAARFDTITLRDRPGFPELPDACFIFGHLFLVFDHYTDLIYLIGLNYREHEIDLEAAAAETERRLYDLDFNYLAPPPAPYRAELMEREGEKEEYLSGVEKVRDEIIRGNLLQGVLSRRLRIRTNIPAIEAYKNLRSANPSPYLFYLDFGRYQIFGSSPEVHVKVKEGTAEVHPIAGTRRRGTGPEEDLKLAQELKADEKEQAEHLMLVDLARNDLGRFCRKGTVQVSRYMEVERYSHVMHLVSRVQGELEEGKSGIEAIRATFPAGTVSGAPKIRAIQVIDLLENERRGFYAGLVGYVEPDGSVDTCITIRSALKIDDTLILQAGAGIVYDSVPEREYEETNEKLRALAGAVGLEV
ncbi:MAG: chorismate-binding protein [Spirochaetota bacterium]|nr:chorismate-binding protein [Spirochaetota bacterium]